MKFDLYGSLSPQPKMTTVDALKAAVWTRVAVTTWELVWQDHTEYADSNGDSGEWMCQLEFIDGEWVYDFEHDFRGGPQNGNGTGLGTSASLEVVQAKAKRGLENWIDRWTDSAEEARRTAAAEEN